jgi:hypothetical protein
MQQGFLKQFLFLNFFFSAIGNCFGTGMLDRPVGCYESFQISGCRTPTRRSCALFVTKVRASVPPRSLPTEPCNHIQTSPEQLPEFFRSCWKADLCLDGAALPRAPKGSGSAKWCSIVRAGSCVIGFIVNTLVISNYFRTSPLPTMTISFILILFYMFMFMSMEWENVIYEKWWYMRMERPHIVVECLSLPLLIREFPVEISAQRPTILTECSMFFLIPSRKMKG